MEKEFNLQWQWQQYLKRAEVSEDMLSHMQAQEMKRAFYGCAGQMLIMLRDDLTELEDSKAADTLSDMLKQVEIFWETEIKNTNK